MFQYFQIYVIFVFYTLLQVKYCQENETADAESYTDILPREKCAKKLCFCGDFLKLGAICNISDVHPFARHFILNLTFTDSKFKHLPARAFLGFDIWQLFLDDPEMTVDENVFEDMISMHEFNVKQSAIKTIPKFQFVGEEIELIIIIRSRLSSLEGQNLQNLTKLWHLKFALNSIRWIDPDILKGTENIQWLDFSFNLLTSLPPKLFFPLKKLSQLGVYRNNLLHLDNVFFSEIPAEIWLGENNLTSVSTILQLSEEAVKKFLSESIRTDVINIHIFRCEPDKFDKDQYKIISVVRMLHLPDNYLQELSQTFFPCYWHQWFERITSYMLNVENILLSGNKLKNLNVVLRYVQTFNVNCSRNQIQYLSDEDFTLTIGTAHLDFHDNQIERIDTDTFKPIRISLRSLDLSSNLIRSLNGSIRYLARVAVLKLENNLIEFFEVDEFHGLSALSEFHLQQNKIKSLVQLLQIPLLRYLNIQHNDIELIKKDQLPSLLKSIHLADNPFKCDCRLQPFIDQVIANDSLSTDVGLCLRSYVEENRQNYLNCPDDCSCRCSEDGNIAFMFVDCSSRNLSLVPQFSRNFFTQEPQMERNDTIPPDVQRLFEVNQNVHSELHIQDRVLGVNMENNDLESLDGAQLPLNLTQLYLSNNKLRSLPESIFEKQLELKQVTLSENPWNCDCNSLKFKKWLTSRHDIIRDINNTRCGKSDKGPSELNGKIIWTLTDLEVCPTDVGMIVSLSFGIPIFLTLFLAAKLLYNKYNLNIKVYIYSRGFTFVKEEDLDHDKLFDAFFSFSHKDGELVTKEILLEIEKKDPNIRLCIHYRDFMPGEFIHDNIIRAVENSKRTVMILSKDFLESEWCLLEFRAAHTQALKDRIHRIIVIKVGDLPKELDSSIKIYLDNTTYLTWGEKNFWDKLLYILPCQSSVRNPNPVCVEDIEFV